MKVETLTCAHCGALLAVPGDANFVRCNHCSNQLAIRRETSVSYTEKVAQYSAANERLVDELAEQAYQDELTRLDREFEGRWLLHHSRPNDSMMTRRWIVFWIYCVVMGLVSGGFVILGTMLSVQEHSLDGFLGGMMVFSIYLLGLVFIWNLLKKLQQAKGQYEERRRDISLETIRQRIGGTS